MVDLALQTVYKGIEKGTFRFWKLSEMERKRCTKVAKMAEGQCQERKQRARERGGKGETRACWTRGKTGHNAAWCRKEGKNNLYAIGEDDSENVEGATDNEEDLQVSCLLEESEHEQ